MVLSTSSCCFPRPSVPHLFVFWRAEFSKGVLSDNFARFDVRKLELLSLSSKKPSYRLHMPW